MIVSPRRWGVGVVVLAAALSGCGQVEAGSAAIVGDRRISTAELQQATQDINAFTGKDTPVSDQEILIDMIIGPFVVDRVAKAQASALMSDIDARRQLEQKVPGASQAAVEVLRVNRSLQQMQQLGGAAAQSVFSGVVADVKKADVQVNPRFGRLDVNQMAVLPVNRNWLQTPAPTPTVAGGNTPEPSPTP